MERFIVEVMSPDGTFTKEEIEKAISKMFNDGNEYKYIRGSWSVEQIKP